jgi:hypothetical protein
LASASPRPNRRELADSRTRPLVTNGSCWPIRGTEPTGRSATSACGISSQSGKPPGSKMPAQSPKVPRPSCTLTIFTNSHSSRLHARLSAFNSIEQALPACGLFVPKGRDAAVWRPNVGPLVPSAAMSNTHKCLRLPGVIGEEMCSTTCKSPLRRRNRGRVTFTPFSPPRTLSTIACTLLHCINARALPFAHYSPAGCPWPHAVFSDGPRPGGARERAWGRERDSGPEPHAPDV